MLEKLFVKIESEKKVVWMADKLYTLHFVGTVVAMTVAYLEGAVWCLVLVFALWLLASGIWLEWKNGA